MIITLVIFSLYFAKLCIRLPRQLRKQVTFEQKAALNLTGLLLLFNDPFYAIHLFRPSFFSFIFTELTSAMFIGGLLAYWLRELANFRPQNAPEDSNCFTKLIFVSLGNNRCA